MIGLSKITDKILAEAQAQADAKMAEADAKCAEIGREYDQKAAQIRAQIDEQTKREAAEIVSRAKSSEAMLRRNTALEAESEMIDEAFEMARKEILNLSNERYLEMLLMLLSSALRRQAEDEKLSRELYGEGEDAPQSDRYEVILNLRDRERCGEALIKEIGVRMGKENKAMTEKLALSEETAMIDGGLILRYGDIEINCSLKALFAQIRPELEAKVKGRLFPEKAGKAGKAEKTEKTEATEKKG